MWFGKGILMRGVGDGEGWRVEEIGKEFWWRNG